MDERGMAKHADEVVEDAHVGESSAAGEGQGEGNGRRRPWARRKQKSYSHVHYKVYKRRWFGLAQLVLLNVVVSWDVSVDFIWCLRDGVQWTK
jgi:FLVCR family MFS transporter 7